MSIKKITLLIAFFIFISGISFTDEGKSKWKIILESSYSQDVNTAGFLNESFGITIGYAGASYYSTDGGKTWQQAKNKSLCRYGLDILDEKTAFSSGVIHVRMTDDGGRNWTALADFGSREPDHSKFISFSDKLNGWIAAGNTLMSTSDGGEKWNKLEYPKEIKNIYSLFLRTPEEGYILDNTGNLAVTSDGGKLWVFLTVPFKEGKLITADIDIPIATVRFADSSHGIVIVYFIAPDRGWKAFITSDGGKNWVSDAVPGNFGAVYMTRDGKYLTVVSINNKKISLIKRQ